MPFDYANTCLGMLDGKEVNIRQCRDWLNKGDSSCKRKLSDLLRNRLLDRYFEPHLESQGGFHASSTRHFADRPGFLMTASACMLIESLQRYRMEFLANSTYGHGENLFEAFFSDVDSNLQCLKTKQTHLYKRATSDLFVGLGASAVPPLDFWDDIRCGILHVGESRSGWRLWRYNYADKSIPARNAFDESLPICDCNLRIIYADRLLVSMKQEVCIACDAFSAGKEWDSFKKAMRKTCEVCEAGKH